MNLKAMGKLAALPLLVLCTACGPALATSVAPTPTHQAESQGEAPAPLETAAAPVDPSPVPAAPASPASEGPLAALVNDEPIYLADYERELGQYEADLPSRGIDPSSPEGQADLADARVWILDWMVTEKLIEQAAAEAGVMVSDEEVDAAMQEMIDENGGEESFMAKLAARGETYEDARQKVRVGLIVGAMNQRIIEGVPTVAEHVHARHILVDTSQEAERIHAQLQAGADFAALAKAYSQDPNTRETGGDLGFFPRGILTAPEVEEAAFALQPGQFSEVVPSLLGYHIVQVVERDPNREVSPDNLHLLQERALQEWVEGLWAQAVIQRFVETNP
jgi:parvulin-like peptidyl-prolyl isomerase